MHAAAVAAITVTVAAAVTACASKSDAADTTAAASSAAMAATSDSTGWRTLFDGTSTDAFRGFKIDSMPSGWTIVDSALTKSGNVGDLVTRDQFTNFELSFDWKIGPKGNSGIMYRVTEEYNEPYWSGPEYQLLDDANTPDGKKQLTAAASVYDLIPSAAGLVKPAGEWNSGRIIVNGTHVEHWLNGQKALEYELQSPDWDSKVKASKFGAWANFGRASAGYIAIQGNHPGDLALRNIKIRELK
jgi:hypothetical protein